jgi:predicted nuclease of predicted toxin-antitoxin system
MKLMLFDQNLSPSLVGRLADLYPSAAHVQALGLAASLDRVVWEYAHQHDYIIVTKDADFSELSLLFGFPPKVIWIRHGNCSTTQVEALLRENHESIVALSDNPDVGILTLF